MIPLYDEIQRTPMLWLLPCAPFVLLVDHLSAGKGAYGSPAWWSGRST